MVKQAFFHDILQQWCSKTLHVALIILFIKSSVTTFVTGASATLYLSRAVKTAVEWTFLKAPFVLMKTTRD